MYTFLFTDIEDSTQLWERQPQAMSAALAYHDSVMAETIGRCQGKIFKTVGDGVYAVFDSADNALQAALAIQSLLFRAANRPNAPLLPLAVRMGLYSGEAEERANDYFGTTLNRTARVMSAAHGRQILLSATTQALLPPGVELRDLGLHRLRDVNEPEHIYQAVSPDFPLNFKPIRSLTPRPTNLPAQLTSFVGRGQDLDEVCRRLRRPGVRLLSLLGPGGIGKTRLSMQVGTNLLDEYEDGVFFIPLASFNQTDAIIKYVAQALSVQEDAAMTLLDSVKAHLESRQILLIFDNFEHILESAPVLNDLLVAAARVKVLVTSRESLFIYGETTYTVQPLNLPEPGDDVSRLLRSAAVTLFVERVQAMDSEFVLADANAPDVVEICRQLDGLPLALELAAARVRDLSLEEIAGQITRRLALLSKGPRDLPKRQQTMRGAIEWSYELLSDDEQLAFARLAVFEGQFLAPAAGAIAGIADMSAFRNKSLVQESAEQSYFVLAVLREYATERLADFGETTATRQRHSVYYCQWIEDAQDHLTGREQIAWFSRLRIEQYNLRTALAWVLDRHETENAGRIVGVLWRYWATQSLLSEGGQWINQVLARADELSPLTRAKVTHGAGRLALLRHEMLASIAFQQTSLSLYSALEYLPGMASILLSLGETEYIQGNHIQAENYLGESLGLFRLLDDEAGTGRCLNIMGQIVMHNGDFAKAELFIHESLSLARAHGSAEGIALALYELASALRAQGKYQEAEAHFREALMLYRELDLAVGVATLLYSLGFTLQALGQHDTARDHFLEALQLLQTLDEPIAIAECLVGIAGIFLRQDKRRLCIQSLSAANAILTSLDAQDGMSQMDKAEYDRIYVAAQLDEEQWQAAWATGQSAPLEQLIRDVLNEAQPPVAA